MSVDEPETPKIYLLEGVGNSQSINRSLDDIVGDDKNEVNRLASDGTDGHQHLSTKDAGRTVLPSKSALSSASNGVHETGQKTAFNKVDRSPSFPSFGSLGAQPHNIFTSVLHQYNNFLLSAGANAETNPLLAQAMPGSAASTLMQSLYSPKYAYPVPVFMPGWSPTYNMLSSFQLSPLQSPNTGVSLALAPVLAPPTIGFRPTVVTSSADSNNCVASTSVDPNLLSAVPFGKNTANDQSRRDQNIGGNGKQAKSLHKLKTKHRDSHCTTKSTCNKLNYASSSIKNESDRTEICLPASKPKLESSLLDTKPDSNRNEKFSKVDEVELKSTNFKRNYLTDRYTNVNSSINNGDIISDGDLTSTSSTSFKPHIKKPLNAFMLYMKEMRPVVMEEEGLKERQSAEINRILGKRWHDLSHEEQQKYYEIARRVRQEHLQKYPGWSARDNYAIHKKKKRKRDRLVEGLDSSEAKKCRARFGLDQQSKWCKHCRRKKKCLWFKEPQTKGSGTGSVSSLLGSLDSGSASSAIRQPNRHDSSMPSDLEADETDFDDDNMDVESDSADDEVIDDVEPSVVMNPTATSPLKNGDFVNGQQQHHRRPNFHQGHQRSLIDQRHHHRRQSNLAAAAIGVELSATEEAKIGTLLVL